MRPIRRIFIFGIGIFCAAASLSFGLDIDTSSIQTIQKKSLWIFRMHL